MFVQLGDGRLYALVMCCALTVLAGGCASTPPQPKFAHNMVTESRITATDTVEVMIETADKITVDPDARDRVAHKIQRKIDARKVNNPAAAAPRNVQVLLHVTRYEKGNAFARAMLAGLGQIHLEGTIFVYQMPDRVLLEDFDLQKTFAWGGIYGAATSMEEIEDTFTDTVAATVTGQLPPSSNGAATTHKTGK